MATAPNVFALFGAINRKSALIALSNAVRAVEYKEGLTMGQIGGELDVDSETVETSSEKRKRLIRELAALEEE